MYFEQMKSKSAYQLFAVGITDSLYKHCFQFTDNRTDTNAPT